MVTAELNKYRQSPRKVRLVADAIRGKKVPEALDVLTFGTQKAAVAIKKLLESAVANAKHNEGLSQEDLFVKEIRVDEGFTMKRARPRAHGRAFTIRKRTSRIQIGLESSKQAKK